MDRADHIDRGLRRFLVNRDDQLHSETAYPLNWKLTVRGWLHDSEGKEHCILDLPKEIGWQYADPATKAGFIEHSHLVTKSHRVGRQTGV
jgi:hypothetical protein